MWCGLRSIILLSIILLSLINFIQIYANSAFSLKKKKKKIIIISADADPTMAIGKPKNAHKIRAQKVGRDKIKPCKTPMTNSTPLTPHQTNTRSDTSKFQDLPFSPISLSKEKL
jgi:hypothetical protein